jgi:hypothetical protein
MFEVIFSVVCFGVLAVEIIEVRHKCEECFSGPWEEVQPFRLEIGERGERFGAG